MSGELREEVGDAATKVTTLASSLRQTAQTLAAMMLAAALLKAPQNATVENPQLKATKQYVKAQLCVKESELPSALRERLNGGAVKKSTQQKFKGGSGDSQASTSSSTVTPGSSPVSATGSADSVVSASSQRWPANKLKGLRSVAMKH